MTPRNNGRTRRTLTARQRLLTRETPSPSSAAPPVLPLTQRSSLRRSSRRTLLFTVFPSFYCHDLSISALSLHLLIVFLGRIGGIKEHMIVIFLIKYKLHLGGAELLIADEVPAALVEFHSVH